MNNRLRKRTLETKEIIKRYEDGESTTEIARLASVSPRYIRMLLKDNNVEMRPRGSWKRKYTLNEDYFKTWSNNMAYILGFFIADGTIATNTQMISFSQKESYILESIRAELNSNHIITKNNSGVYLLNLNSKVMRRDLIELHGVTPNKSNSIQFPKVPDEYLSHFIRGYFDGDGYINYKQYTVTFVGGSQLFMTELMHVLKEKGFQPQLQIQGKNYRVHIRGRRSIKLFSNWIYENKSNRLYLLRKHDIFQKEILPLKDLTDRKHLYTIEAVKRRKLNFLSIYAAVHSVEYACMCIGVKTSTVKRWIKNDELFKDNFNATLKKRGE